MRKRSKWLVFALSATGLGVAMALIGHEAVRPYEQLVRARAPIIRASIKRMSRAMREDMSRYHRCEQTYTKGRERLPDAASRACLLTNAPKVHSAAGAVSFAAMGQLWLTSHPNDKAVRRASLAAIRAGRKALVWRMRHIVRPLDKLRKAAPERLWSFVSWQEGGGKGVGRAAFDRDVSNEAAMLNRAEFAVRLPSVVARQNNWMLRLFAQVSTPNVNSPPMGRLSAVVRPSGQTMDHGPRP